MVLLATCLQPQIVLGQEGATILTGPELSKVIPPGFYFQGQSAPTQIRNAAAVRLGKNRYVIVGLVDTSGYAADVKSVYEGFLITDSQIQINGADLPIGAYGFGVSNDGKLNVLDLAGHQVLSVSTKLDAEMKRPRPLMLAKAGDDVRIYNAKNYATITFN